MRWASLALVIVLGGATILTRNGQFIMVKPSIIHFAIGAELALAGFQFLLFRTLVRRRLRLRTA